MKYETVKTRLEILKSALVCACLLVVLFSSCVTSQRSTAVLNKLVQLQAVVQEVAEQKAECPVNDDVESNLEE